MATSHETEHGGGHPSLGQYILIAILLFAITIVEFVIIMDFPGEAEKVISEALGEPSTTILLFLLSGIKFAIVILFYMHLKFDNKLFFWTFVGRDGAGGDGGTVPYRVVHGNQGWGTEGRRLFF